MSNGQAIVFSLWLVLMLGVALHLLSKLYWYVMDMRLMAYRRESLAELHRTWEKLDKDYGDESRPE